METSMMQDQFMEIRWWKRVSWLDKPPALLARAGIPLACDPGYR